MSVKLYRIKEVSEITGLKPSSIYKQIRLHRFPAGVKITSRSTAWPSNLIEEWIARKISGGKL
jgi:prophage regulatory protein